MSHIMISMRTIAPALKLVSSGGGKEDAKTSPSPRLAHLQLLFPGLGMVEERAWAGQVRHVSFQGDPNPGVTHAA